jgi:C-terminal processing protease CtpA/Prc
VPGLRRAPDDHRVHRLRRLLRVAGRLARGARGGDPRRIAPPGRLGRIGAPRVLLVALLLTLVAACTAPTSSATPAPTRTPDIQRSKLDIVYSAFVDTDVHRVSSKKALEGALDAVRAEVRALGGKADVATPAFQDVDEPVLADFRKLADALSELAARTPELSPDRLARAAIGGMIRASPDCHTYYFDGRGRLDSRPVRETGVANPAPPSGQVVAQADEAGLSARLLEGGVAYVRWTEFRITGTYDIRAKVKTVLEKALAAGAKAWLFDMRGNVGGNGPEIIASYFLRDEAVMEIHVRTGKAGVRSANPAFRLPEEYQLPIALVQNDQGGSGPEILALFFKETKRGTIVGGKSVGCVGSASPTALPDGTQFLVVSEEYVGAITGTRYNNSGIPPDVTATDAAAIETAAKLLRDRIAAGR